MRNSNNYFILDVITLFVKLNLTQHFHLIWITTVALEVSNVSNNRTITWQGIQLGLMKLITNAKMS